MYFEEGSEYWNHLTNNGKNEVPEYIDFKSKNSNGDVKLIKDAFKIIEVKGGWEQIKNKDLINYEK